MTRTIDLMPYSARARSMRRVNRRRWIAAYCVASLGVALLVGATRLRTVSLERELASVQRAVQREAEQNRAVLEIGSELLLIGDRIEQQARLAPGPTVRDTLRTITAAAPQSMSLVSFAYDQRRAASASDVRSMRRTGNETARASARVDIAGVALSDTDIARFITDLERTGMFESTSLEYARPIRVRQTEAREFRIGVTVRSAALPDTAKAEATR